MIAHIKNVKVPSSLEGFDHKYSIYAAPNQEDSMKYLEENPVDDIFSPTLVVVSPVGIFCRDTTGIFEKDDIDGISDEEINRYLNRGKS